MPIAHFAEKRVRFLAAAVGAALAIAVIAVTPDSTAAIGSDNTWVSLGAIRAGHSTAAQATPFYSSSRNVFFASNSGGGYRSTDGGDSFAERNSGLQDPRVSSIGVSPRFEFDALVLASTPTGLYRSVDGALNWAGVTGGLPETESSGVAFAPDFAGISGGRHCNRDAHRNRGLSHVLERPVVGESKHRHDDNTSQYSADDSLLAKLRQ